MPCSVIDTAGHAPLSLSQTESDLFPLDHFRRLGSRMSIGFLMFQDFFLPSFLPTQKEAIATLVAGHSTAITRFLVYTASLKDQREDRLPVSVEGHMSFFVRSMPRSHVELRDKCRLLLGKFNVVLLSIQTPATSCPNFDRVWASRYFQTFTRPCLPHAQD